MSTVSEPLDSMFFFLLAGCLHDAVSRISVDVIDVPLSAHHCPQGEILNDTPSLLFVIPELTRRSP